MKIAGLQIGTVSSKFPIAAGYFALVGTVGVSMNVLVIYVVIRDHKLLTPINGLLLNLATSDMFIAVVGTPVAFVNAFHGDWYFGRAVCTLYGFLMAFFGITSITTLAVLALDRYLIICRPFSFQITWTNVGYTIIGIWLFSFILTMPPLVGWGDYEPEAKNISCSMNWHTRTPNAQSYIMSLYVVALIGPVSVITFCYLQILRTISKTKRFRKDTKFTVAKKKETRIALMVLLMAGAFLFAWGPYAVCSLLISFTNYQLNEFLLTAPCFFAKSSPCYNPVIYFFFNSQFRASFLKTFNMQRWISEESVLQGRAATLTELKQINRGRNRLSSNQREEIKLWVISNEISKTADTLFSCNTDPVPRKKNLAAIHKKFSLPLLMELEGVTGGGNEN